MSFISLIILLWMTMTPGESSEDEVMKSCCQQGRSQVDADCGEFAVPIANISQEHQNLCIATMEVCCIAAKRETACQEGQQKAKEGLTCQAQDNQPNNCEFQRTMTECCIACKMGSMFEGECSGRVNLLPSSLAQNSFIKCCFGGNNNQIVPDDRCPRGFTFNHQLQVCDDVDECYENLDNCDENFEVCKNTLGDYTCEPLIIGEAESNSTDTISCPTGFRFYLISCLDIDECAENAHNCSSNQICVNTEGAFECQKWEANGPILCPRGYRLDNDQCVDINECATDHNCNEESQRCVNTLGSYNCVRFLPCGTGYTFNSHMGRCEDDDECALGLHNCQSLGPAYYCRNTQGSFRCDRRECSRGELLNEETGHCQPVICQAGYEADVGGLCIDTDECQQQANICPSDSACQNTLGSYQCVRKCPNGMKLAEDGENCEDIDECSQSSSLCPSGKMCTNFMGGYRCDCPSGFRLNEEDACEDVDECLSAFTVCGVESECQNFPGSYRCTCKSGFRRNSDDRCVDINECQSISGICQQRCANLWGSYRCHCRPGYRLSTDGRSCIDIDECEEYQDICIGNCRNEPGSYKCTCPQGYLLSSNERSCQDIDECKAPGGSPCRVEGQTCFNTRGGFKCVDTSCPSSYEEEGSNRRCKLKSEARVCPDPQDVECLRRPISLSFNFIALVSNLRIAVTSPNQLGIDLFTMQSARYYTLTTKFTLEVKNVRAAKDVPEKVDRSFFRLKTPEPHRAILSLVKPIQGPQDIQLELRMDMYHLGRYQASAVANLYIFVTPYKF